MATIPRAYLDNFNEVIKALSDDAKAKLEKALESVDASDLDALRSELIAILEAILLPYTDNAAAVAAVFYDGIRAYEGISDGFYALSDSRRKTATTIGAVYAYTNKHDTLDDVLKRQLIKQVGYEIKLATNECIEYNAKRDPLEPRWARVPQNTPVIYEPWSKEKGVTHNKELAAKGTCLFCDLLASRGFDYHSKETASHAHDDCDCVIIPGFKKDTKVEGYDQEKYENEYTRADKAIREGKLSEDMQKRIAKAKQEHDAAYEAGETKVKWSSMNAVLIVMRDQQGA